MLTRDYVQAYEKWVKSTVEEERRRLEEYLDANLISTWNAGDADVKVAVIDYIRLHPSRERIDVLIDALRDENESVASIALAMISLLIWKGHSFDRVRLRGELSDFTERYPRWSALCRDVREKLQGHEA